MCTVTYLPFAEEEFILTSSRDEKTIRPSALVPQTALTDRQLILYPKDRQGGGTWIATASYRAVCLLNGAFKVHQPLASYKHSRGKVVIDLFSFPSVDNFVGSYDFIGIEPFTLVVIEHNNLYELRWNGIRLYMKLMDAARPHIWSSVTLYDTQIRNRRKTWFRHWLQQTGNYNVETIRNFHKTAGQGDPQNSLVMNRNNLIRTVSLTSIIHTYQQVEMIYEDLVSNKQHYASLAAVEAGT